ncbi:hypothetical protein GCM10010182_45780 [Actinomadura cremea]|nr:hypothetical protein GCM10010182_45780 [Actinomadura cremea]
MAFNPREHRGIPLDERPRDPESVLLLVTGAAAAAIRNMSTPGPSDGVGMRIAPQGGDASLLAMTPARTPASDDEVVEAEGVRLFLDPSAAAVLQGKVLDARVDEQGSVTFLVHAPSP